MEDLPELHLSTRYFISCSLNYVASKNKIFRLKKFRAEANNGGVPVLYLNAGDTYTGTPWFYVHKDRIVTAFMNLLKPDAIVSKRACSL